MSDITIEEPKKPNMFVRIIVIAGMLLILFFIALAIVKYVPKIISAISPANVSLTSLFNPGTTATSTSATGAAQSNSSNYNPAPDNGQSATTAATSSNATTNTGSNTSGSNTGSTRRTATTYTYNTPSYTPSYNAPVYSGPSDLSITLIKVGQVNADGSFIQTSSIQPGARVQVQFLVANVGSGRSGSWSLNAVLPTSIGAERVYNSQIEPSIAPGASYQMTLAFDAYDPSQQSIQITLTASGDVNTGNNILITPLTSNGNNYNSNTSNNCYWSNGYQYCNNNNYNNNSNNNGCYWNNGYQYCNNNYNNNNGCYYSNGSYYCNNNSGNNVNGSDLSVVITNIGTMDRNSGQFYSTSGSTFNRGDKVAVQFTVTNVGSTSSGNWTFNATLPSNSATYSSGTQSSIGPGQTITFVVGFDYPNTGSQNISVQLYPQGADANSSNNYVTRSIYVNN